MGWREVLLSSLGMVHYLVPFVTLYQRLSSGDWISTMLRSVFFLFFAAPNIVSLVWYSISNSFDTGATSCFGTLPPMTAVLCLKRWTLADDTGRLLAPFGQHEQLGVNMRKVEYICRKRHIKEANLRGLEATGGREE
ncbi:Uncharacterized protein Fot_51532 [Forsythia ovata]|uniref:Uncharacterized protein n=1 Tax=Forsythia ovata TaxID=205694 RepID=A0ABD1PWR5_9LAMI